MPFLQQLHKYKVQGKIHARKEMEEGRKRKCLIHITGIGAGTAYSVQRPGYGWMSKRMWFDSFNGKEIYLFSKITKLDSVFFPQSWNDWAIKLAPLTPTGTKIKNYYNYTSSPPYAFMICTRTILSFNWKKSELSQFCKIQSLHTYASDDQSLLENYSHMFTVE